MTNPTTPGTETAYRKIVREAAQSFRDASFTREELRDACPVDQVSDDQLRDALEHLTARQVVYKVDELTFRARPKRKSPLSVDR